MACSCWDYFCGYSLNTLVINFQALPICNCNPRIICAGFNLSQAENLRASSRCKYIPYHDLAAKDDCTLENLQLCSTLNVLEHLSYGEISRISKASISCKINHFLEQLAGLGCITCVILMLCWCARDSNVCTQKSLGSWLQHVGLRGKQFMAVAVKQSPCKIKSELESGTVCGYWLFVCDWKHFALCQG